MLFQLNPEALHLILNRQEITLMINCVPADYLHMRMGYAVILGVRYGDNFEKGSKEAKPPVFFSFF